MSISGAGSGYDYNAITFSPDGRLFQVEYAAKAVEKDWIAIGVNCSNGILFATLKIKKSPMLRPEANPRIFWIDQQIVCATIGYRPDCLAAVSAAREEAASYLDNFGCPISVSELTARVAMSFHQTHHIWGCRPYGAALVFGSSIDKSLYALEPSGHYYGYKACSYGKMSKMANAELAKYDWKEKTIDEARDVIINIIKGLYANDQQFQNWEIELCKLTDANNGKPVKEFVSA